MTPAEAHEILVAAEQDLVDAQHARDAAAAGLDDALSAAGWVRLTGGFSPLADPLYTSAAYEAAGPQRLANILVTLEQQAAA